MTVAIVDITNSGGSTGGGGGSGGGGRGQDPHLSW